MSELADQHVATLASSNPVMSFPPTGTRSSPWFEGKIPFTFNLPELQGSPFVLLGGRVAYVNQSPGTELIFRVRQHQYLGLHFPGAGVWEEPLGTRPHRPPFPSKSVRWCQNGLCYFVIGDASPQDLDKLSELLKAAG